MTTALQTAPAADMEAMTGTIALRATNLPAQIAYPDDVETLRKSAQNYLDAGVDNDLYIYNPKEQHARSFEEQGLPVYNALKLYLGIPETE